MWINCSRRSRSIIYTPHAMGKDSSRNIKAEPLSSSGKHINQINLTTSSKAPECGQVALQLMRAPNESPKESTTNRSIWKLHGSTRQATQV